MKLTRKVAGGRLEEFSHEPVEAFAAVLTIHHAPDGVVMVRRPSSVHLNELDVHTGSYRGDKLAAMDEQEIIKLQQTDSRFSLLSWWRGATLAEKNIRYLTAIGIDLDIHSLKSGELEPHTQQSAMNEVLTLADEKVIPAPSFIWKSGRGLWLVYMLRHNSRSITPPRVAMDRRGRRKIRFYHEVAFGLCDILDAVAPRLNTDRAASTAKTMMRVPGSISSRSLSQVSGIALFDPRGRPWRYTLDTLAVATGTRPAIGHRERFIAAKKGTCPNRRAGHEATWNNRLRELGIVCRFRGFTPDNPHKHKSQRVDPRKAAVGLTILSHIRLGKEARVGYREGAALNRLYNHPPLDDAEMNEVWQETVRLHVEGSLEPTNATLGRRLGITVEEANEMGLEKLRPDAERVAYKKKADPYGTRARREAVAEIIEGDDRLAVPPKEVRAELVERGFMVSEMTVYRDIRALGLTLPSQVAA